jgi:hypothetical protein
VKGKKARQKRFWGMWNKRAEKLVRIIVKVEVKVRVRD